MAVSSLKFSDLRNRFWDQVTYNPFTLDYLVLAGGAAAAGGNGEGGGGAGGLRCTVTNTGGGGTLESALSLIPGTSYTVTVGAGGAVTTDVGTPGNGSIFNTITTVGGGPSAPNTNGSNSTNGGCGGGGSYNEGTNGWYTGLGTSLGSTQQRTCSSSC